MRRSIARSIRLSPPNSLSPNSRKAAGSSQRMKIQKSTRAGLNKIPALGSPIGFFSPFASSYFFSSVSASTSAFRCAKTSQRATYKKERLFVSSSSPSKRVLRSLTTSKNVLNASNRWMRIMENSKAVKRREAPRSSQANTKCIIWMAQKCPHPSVDRPETSPDMVACQPLR